jgi:hypothetical protein
MDPLAVTQTIALVKKAIQLASNLKDLEIRDALIAAREALNDQREVNLALKDENHDLKEKVSDLLLQIKKNTQVEPGIDCYEKTAEGGQKYAICSNCWETKEHAVTLTSTDFSSLTCPSCKNYFVNIPKNKFVNIR